MKRFAAVVSIAGASSAVFAAQIFGQDVNVDTAPVLTLAGVIVAAIGGIWAVKKVISLANKS